MTEIASDFGKFVIQKITVGFILKSIGLISCILIIIILLVIVIITTTLGQIAAFSESQAQSSLSEVKIDTQNSNSNLPVIEINKNNNLTVVYQNKTYYLPVIKPENKNLFYALLGIRFAESHRPENTYQPNDRDSCGQYQQRVSELYNGGLKTDIARQILGNKFNSIFTSQRIADVNRWNYKASNVVNDGEIKLIPVAGGYVAYYPQGMESICKDLVENHLETGLFDLIALERFKERGIYDYLLSYDLQADNAYNFSYQLCRSQAPASCDHWVANSLPSLRIALQSNLYDSLAKK